MRYILAALIFITANFDNPTYIADLEKTVQTDPSDWQTRLKLAEIFIEQGNFTDAMIYLEQADAILLNIDQGPEKSLLHYIWGLYHDRQDNIPKAMDKYKAAVEADSSCAKAWRNLGYLHEIFLDGEKMLECFNKARPFTIDSAGIFYDIGVAYDYMDSLEQAIKHYHMVLNLTNEIPEAYLNLGVDLGMLGHTDSAGFYFGEAEAAGAGGPELYYNLGVITFEAGNAEMALGNFLHVLALEPSYAPAKLMLGDVYEAMGDSGMARVYYEEFVNTASILYLDDINAVREKLIEYNK